MKVGVVAIAGAFDSGLTMVLDVLRAADTARPLVDRSIPPIDVVVLGEGTDLVPTGGGLLVPVDRSYQDDLGDLDLLVIPAIGTNAPGSIEAALQRRDVQALRARLVDWRDDPVSSLAAACTGTFVLADAGLLDGRRATTTWWLTETFTRRYPLVDLDLSRMVVRDGFVTTAGAAFAHIDLAVDIVARVSPELATTTMRTLLIDERTSVGVAPQPGRAADDRIVVDFEAWVRANIEHDVSVADAAAEIGTTRRTLERRVLQQLGTTPAGFLRQVRLERARHLRRTTTLSFDEVAVRVGYRNGTTLRAALRRAAGPGSGR